jgi:hypothetical protein
MPYELSQSPTNPRLLILLTDQLEESVRVVNRLIDLQIQLNFDGNAPKNSCFITVIGYNNGIKELVSGWLKDLYDAPVRFESYKKWLSDGAGGTIEVNCKQPIWVESANSISSSDSFTDSIRLAIEISKEWSRDYDMAPIVIDCSEVFQMDCSTKEIEQLKNVSSTDGKTLFWGCYHSVPSKKCLFSKIPQEWFCLFNKRLLFNTEYMDGCYDSDSICAVISTITDVGS